MSFDELWQEMEHEESVPATEQQKYYIDILLDQTKATDEQRRYWEQTIDGFWEAQAAIKELEEINKMLNHPRFSGGGMTFTDWKEEYKNLTSGRSDKTH